MNTTARNGIDENLTERSEKFSKSIYKYVYRIPLKYLCDAGLVNQCFKLNTKYLLTLETGMQKLFKTNTNQRADDLPRSVDADIVFTSPPYIMHEQFKLDDNFITYLERVMLSEHVHRSSLHCISKILLTG